jgi:hypothetical protein
MYFWQQMKTFFFYTFLLAFLHFSFAQQIKTEQLEYITGSIVNAANDAPMAFVDIVNISRVKGDTSDGDGEFGILANINDTLHFSYLGFKPIQVKITQDWVTFGDVKIKMTEAGIGIEDVEIRSMQLTGFLEIDAKNIPLYDNYRYSISNLDYGYEGGGYQRSSFARVMESIFNPSDFLYKTFGRKKNDMAKLRLMKADTKIKSMLMNKYDRETLSAILQISKYEIENILKRCDYSRDYIRSANDLQVLDAISNCYEDYRAINR